MRAHFLQYILLFILVHKSEFLENLIKSYCTRLHFDVVKYSMGTQKLYLPTLKPKERGKWEDCIILFFFKVGTNIVP